MNGRLSGFNEMPPADLNPVHASASHDAHQRVPSLMHESAEHVAPLSSFRQPVTRTTNDVADGVRSCRNSADPSTEADSS
jgi:hypothetical protein